MLTKRLSEITILDIQALRGVAESRYLDFKSAPVGAADRDRREFLADVTAFANGSGGDIVFGVTTTDGAAADVPGIELADADKEKLRLGDLIRSGAEPRLNYFDMVWLPIEGARGVLIIRVPRSWIAPHRVTLQGHDKFYARNSAGKHPMNVGELRSAFTLSETIVERIRGFRSDRLNFILSEEGPFSLMPGAQLVFHGVPFSAFVDPPSLDLSDYSKTRLFPPFGSGGHSWQHTLEGLATHTPLRADGIRAYTMLFRNGIIEAVAGLTIEGGNATPRLLELFRVEHYILEGWAALTGTAREYGIEAPFYIFVSIIGVRGVAAHFPETWMLDENTVRPCRQDRLVLPELEVGIDSVGQPSTALFKDIFDRIANAFGLSGSPSYDQAGRYRSRR
jgi:Putative DNA-binding domain